MSAVDEQGEQRPRYVQAACGLASDGKIRVYAGDLKINDGESTWIAQGDLILSPGERPAFSAHFAAEDPRLMSCLFGAMDAEISVPEGAVLSVSPVETLLVKPEEKVPALGAPGLDSSVSDGNRWSGFSARVRSLSARRAGRRIDHPARP